MITKLDSFYAQIPPHHWRSFPNPGKYAFMRARTWGYRLRLGGTVVEEGPLHASLPMLMYLERHSPESSPLAQRVIEHLLDKIDSKFTFDQFELVVYWRWVPAMPARLFATFARRNPEPEREVIMTCDVMRFAA